MSEVDSIGPGSLPFGLVRCANDPWTWIEADPSYYRDEPVYSNDDQPIEAVAAWAAGQPAFEELWVDRSRNGWISLGFSDGAADRQRDLEAEFPGVGVVAVALEHTAAELESLASSVMQAISDTPYGFGLGASVPAGQVILDVAVLDEATLAPLAEFADRPLCVRGADPADAIPEAPQPQFGDGWRLLAAQRGGAGYRTGVATTDDQYAAVWRLGGLEADRPPVDFDTEIVIWFGSVYGSGCEHRMDDVVVDVERAVVYGRFVVPGPPPMCNADANPEAYVIAMERSLLPSGPFAVQLGPEPPPLGAPEERTVVGVDLTPSGAVATDDQIGFDPELVDDPWRIDLVQPGMGVEPGVRFTYALSSHCNLALVGPIGGVVWTSERSEGDTSPQLPEPWVAGRVEQHAPVVVTGVVEIDWSGLTFEANGHVERFVPAAADAHSDCH